MGLCLCILYQCSQKQEKTDPLMAQLEELDTLLLKKHQSAIVIDRHRIFKNKQEQFKLGKLGIKLKINDLSTAVKVEYKIDSGILVYNKKVFELTCFVNTKQIVTPVVDQNKQLSMGTPGYLLNAPNNQLIFQFKGSIFPETQAPTATLYLDKGDGFALVENAEVNTKRLPKGKIKTVAARFYLNGLNWQLFEKENEQELIKDSLNCVMQLEF